MMTKATRIPVGKRALLARINRRLKEDGETLKATRGERMRLDCGDFYVVNLSRNAVTRKNIDLEVYGRSIGALQGWEALVDD